MNQWGINVLNKKLLFSSDRGQQNNRSNPGNTHATRLIFIILKGDAIKKLRVNVTKIFYSLLTYNLLGFCVLSHIHFINQEWTWSTRKFILGIFIFPFENKLFLTSYKGEKFSMTLLHSCFLKVSNASEQNNLPWIKKCFKYVEPKKHKVELLTRQKHSIAKKESFRNSTRYCIRLKITLMKWSAWKYLPSHFFTSFDFLRDRCIVRKYSIYFLYHT